MTDLDRYQYGYDQNSNRLWKANVVGTGAVGNLDEGYAYDNLNRLTQMKRGTLSGGVITGTPVREMDYTLDPTGNWSAYLTKTSGTTDLNQTRGHSPVNAITAIAGTPGWATPPAYDAAGNMNSFPQPATPSSAFTAVYDAWNRLVSISDTAGSVATYQYDGRNRRIVKDTVAISETRHFYYTSHNQDIEERVGASTSMDKQYVWGIRYVDELVCRDDATPERLYATQDANFNLTALIDTSGTIQQRFLYDPYGNSEVLTAAWVSTTDAYAWTRRFTGQFFDFETGVYYYRARYYQLAIGRFLSRDLSGYTNAQSLYEYVLGRPTSLLDPTGLSVTISGNGITADLGFNLSIFGVTLAGFTISARGNFSVGVANLPRNKCKTPLVSIPSFSSPRITLNRNSRSASVSVGVTEGPISSTLNIGIGFPHWYTMTVQLGGNMTISYLYWSNNCCKRLSATLNISGQQNLNGPLATAALAAFLVAPEIDLGAAAGAFGTEIGALGLEIIAALIKQAFA